MDNIPMRSVELFTGAGGLAMGIAKAGFHHEAIVEWDKNACQTLRANQLQAVEPIVHWPIYEADVSSFDFSNLSEGLELVAGGPPCQPFSLGGKHRGHHDTRNMFPEVVRAVRELKPQAFIFENVKGLLRATFAKYFEYIIFQLTYPEITINEREDWAEHLSRLERYHTCGRHHGLYYRVTFRLLNTADYGVPQKRERVIIVGFRSDIEQEWSFPSPTHSQEALLYSKYISGDYWEKHRVSKQERDEIPAKLINKAGQTQKLLLMTLEKPWKTVRDAISDLPDPENAVLTSNVLNHQFVPGARSYPGHTGSVFDEPAKTLKAGDHGVPGGENTLVLPNNKVRYFTIRESARLQTFPDNYVFSGSWTETMRQLGNAVPVEFSYIIASSVKTCLSEKIKATT